MNVMGLMSGTSADGVDAALVCFEGKPSKPRWKILNSISIEYPNPLRTKIISVGQGTKLSNQEWLELSEAITEFHADVARICDPKGQAKVIGCHGQTIFHRPPEPSYKGGTLQLLQAPLLATLLGKSVVYDFRSKDVALGGHGAPLAPLLDAALLGRVNGWRGVLNLGGIANLSLIPPLHGPEKSFDVLGWDCGPANTLIDLAISKITNTKLSFDKDGLIAAKGSPDLKAIERWLKEPFFQKSPPKSTGRELFGLQDLDRRFNELNQLSNEDFVSTITTFTACVIAQDLAKLFQEKKIRLTELLIAGGGAKNPVLVKEIISRCLGVRVLQAGDVGLPVEAREAISIALLAWWNLLKKKGSSSAITGAKRSAVLGILVTTD